MNVIIRNFRSEEASAVNALAISAFEQYQNHYADWAAFSESLGRTASLADHGEMIVADYNGQIMGAVAYVGPSKPKSAFFDQDWAIMRMLVVSPRARGKGIGRLLAEQCISRAKRDRSEIFALHTTTIMRVAVAMYERMGFTFVREAPAILGVPYGIYTKRLDGCSDR